MVKKDKTTQTLQKTALAAPLMQVLLVEKYGTSDLGVKRLIYQKTTQTIFRAKRNKIMIKYPITNQDLLRSIMAKIPAAQVTFVDPALQRMHADSLLGLCSFTIVRGPEIRETVVAYDLEGYGRPYETTRQQHHVEVNYYDPEDEFEVKLSITQLPA